MAVSTSSIEEHISKLPPVDWTEVQQDSDARLVAWELEEVVFHALDPAFAHLRNDPAEYARTLARLIGLVWVLSANAIIDEERSRLVGEAPSAEFQAACDALAMKLRGTYR